MMNIFKKHKNPKGIRTVEIDVSDKALEEMKKYLDAPARQFYYPYIDVPDCIVELYIMATLKENME